MPTRASTEGVYGSADHLKWIQKVWAKTGKKLDMGKSCVRFKKLEDLALDVIAAAIQRVPARNYIAHVESALQSIKNRPSKGPLKGGRSAKAKKAVNPAENRK